MITAFSTIKHNSKKIIVPGLLLLRTQNFPESEYRNSFVVNTRFGKKLIVADLHNSHFPLSLKTLVTDSGVYLSVDNFALFLQPHGLFLTSQTRVLCRKFDDTPGLMLDGECHRVYDGKQNLFRFNGVLN